MENEIFLYVECIAMHQCWLLNYTILSFSIFCSYYTDIEWIAGQLSISNREICQCSQVVDNVTLNSYGFSKHY